MSRGPGARTAGATGSDGARQVTLAAIEEAAERIAPWVHRTPILKSRQIDEQLGCALRFKGEHLQKAGAFKARGAHNAILQLEDQEAARGVATHSSGNHGAALALAGRNRGIPVTVVMPENAAAVKRAAVAGYGAEIVPCAPTLQAREETLSDVQARSGAVVVHPYEDPRVICGQGTTGLEIVAQCADDPPDIVIAPVGGGGLLAGVAVAVTSLRPDCQVIGAEPCGADDAFRSFRDGRWQPQLAPDTIADGLLTSLGIPNFEIIRERVRDIVTVTDDRIVEAMRLIWTRTKQVVEPSAAVPLAAVLTDPFRFAGRRIVLILSGGNVDVDRLPWTPSGPSA